MDHPVKNDGGKLERKFVVSKIKQLRKEWQEAAGIDVNLDDIRGSVGMLLADVCHALNLNNNERNEAIGSI